VSTQVFARHSKLCREKRYMLVLLKSLSCINTGDKTHLKVLSLATPQDIPTFFPQNPLTHLARSRPQELCKSSREKNVWPCCALKTRRDIADESQRCHGDGCKRGPPADYDGATPRAEPTDATSADYKEWLGEYKDWAVIRCPGPCRLGYYCRQHGLWITGLEVRDGQALKAEDQKNDPSDVNNKCPGWHTDCKIPKAIRWSVQVGKLIRPCSSTGSTSVAVRLSR